MAETLRQQLLDTSRGRIVTWLRAGGRTVEDLAKKLGLTSSAVRIQIAAMDRDGVVKRAGKKSGTTRTRRHFKAGALGNTIRGSISLTART